MKVNVNDWVQGNSKRGELIHGYVEAVDAASGTLDVHVVASDNEEAVGTSLRMQAEWVKSLPVSGEPTESQLRQLVDLALALGDEGWFRELSGRLNELSGRSSAAARPAGKVRPVNRLGQYGLK